jgi:hypothetical protein
MLTVDSINFPCAGGSNQSDLSHAFKESTMCIMSNYTTKRQATPDQLGYSRRATCVSVQDWHLERERPAIPPSFFVIGL